MIKLELNDDSKIIKKRFISLASLGASRTTGDEMRDICISDTLLTNHQEVMSIETGRVSQNELGDMILYSD